MPKRIRSSSWINKSSLNIRITSEAHKKLTAAAKKHDVSLNFITERILEEWEPDSIDFSKIFERMEKELKVQRIMKELPAYMEDSVREAVMWEEEIAKAENDAAVDKALPEAVVEYSAMSDAAFNASKKKANLSKYSKYLGAIHLQDAHSKKKKAACRFLKNPVTTEDFAQVTCRHCLTYNKSSTERR
jgi:hypothetical protein